jgi:predicted RNase H-like HicB family nuclease
MKLYIGIIHKDADSDYGVSFPDFPGCISAGVSLEDARAMGEEALNFHVEMMVEAGEPIPEPSTLDTVMQTPDFRDGVAILVPLKHSPKVVRVNITIADEMLKAVDAYAEEHGFTRSGFLVSAARRAMESASPPTAKSR